LTKDQNKNFKILDSLNRRIEKIMEWTILDSDITAQDPSGVEGFIIRLDEELRRDTSSPIEGFRFLESGKEMLRITREIEDASLSDNSGSTLYVGFQRGEKLANELDRYRRLQASGVPVVGFGHGGQEQALSDVTEQWVNLDLDVKAFENQWYLATVSPTPILFIGWETSSPDMFGKGGISADGKEFQGFISTDGRVVDAAIALLERVRRRHGPKTGMSMDQLAKELKFPIKRMMMVTDDGKQAELGIMRRDIAEFATQKSASILLYDLSAASYLVSPYPSEVHEKEMKRALTPKELTRFGRRYLAEQLDGLKDLGEESGAILPTGHGFGHLAEWAKRENIDMIVIPDSLVTPGLIDRIKGYTMKILREHTDLPVLIYNKSGLAHLSH